MEKPKAGLHKRISSIFDGVPVPKTGEQQQSSALSGMDSRGHLPPKPHVPQRKPQSPPPEPPRQDTFPRAPKQSISEYIAEKFSALKLGQFADKSKIKILIIPLLFIFLIVVLYRNFAGAPGPAAKGSKAQTANNALGVAASAVVWQKPEPYPVFMRDPTQLSAAGSYAAGTGSIAVRGIVYSEDKPAIVIGNEIMHEGDTIGGVTILKINRDGVEFTGQGRIWTQKVQ